MIRKFKNNRGEKYLLVEVPVDSDEHMINGRILNYFTPEEDPNTPEDYYWAIKLPKKNKYSIVAMSGGITEEQAAGIVDNNPLGSGTYIDYVKQDSFQLTALSSFASLLRSYSIKHCVILKKL